MISAPPLLRRLALATTLASAFALLATVLVGPVGPAGGAVPGLAAAGGGAGDDAPPSRAATDDIGVVTYNVLVYRGAGALRREVGRLASRRDVDIIGWQEANKLVRRPKSGGPTPLQRLRGLGFETVKFGKKPKEPISWRTSEFELVSTARHHMCARAPRRAKVDFPPKWLNVVTLRDRDTGALVTVSNVHVTHTAEAWQTRPGRFSRLVTAACAKRIYRELARLWPTFPGYVVAAGDWNFNYKTDRRRKPAGGMARTLGPLAVSNWELFGYRPKARTVTMSTDPRPSRLIDWVLLDRQDVASGAVRPVGHAVLGGYRSDHKPVLVRLALN